MKLLDYCGAGARLDPDRGLGLDPLRWAWMPKVDGVYARVTLDAHGRIARVTARSGADLSDAADLIGIEAGTPHSVLHGELEAHTEAGNRSAATRGWRALHLFDVTAYSGRPVHREPYAVRYGLLHRGHALVEQGGIGRIESWRTDEAGDAHDDSGRYCRMVPRDLRRLPIVALARGGSAGRELWTSHVERGGGEGLVAVRLDAPAGARRGKRKIKATDTLDATVLRVEGGAALLAYRTITFLVSARGRIAADLVPGSRIEVASDGWFESSTTPRFPRIVRLRPDLKARSTPLPPPAAR